MRTRSPWRTGLIPVALLSTLLLGGCVDDAPAGGGGAPAEVPTCDPGEEVCTHLAAFNYTGNVGADGNEAAHVPVRGHNTNTELQVRWTNQAGDPIPNGEIAWTLVDNAGIAGAMLDVSASRTDGTGVATATVRSGPINATFTVEATAPSANKVVFNVDVVSKDEGRVIVKLRYDGGIYGDQARAFADAQVLVFKQGAVGTPGVLNACDQEGFDPYDPNTLPLPAKQSHVFTMLPGEHGFSGFAGGDVVSVLAFGRQRFEERSVSLAWACWTADPNVLEQKVQPGKDLIVELNLRDLEPRYVGVFDVYSDFDFLSMLPDNIQKWVEDIANLFREPGRQILAWLKEIDEVDEFFGNLPAGFDGAIEGVVNDLLNTLLDNVLPDIVQDIRTGVVDVFDILQQLRVRSEMRFDQAPAPPTGASAPGVLVFPRCVGGGAAADEEGVKGAGECPQKETWISIGFNWRNSDVCEGNNNPDCTGFREYSLAAYNLSIVEGEFNAVTEGFWDLTVERHQLSLAWGQLLLFAVEQIILPMLFGPNVDGLDDLIFMLVGGQECIAGDNHAENCCQALVDRDTFSGWAGFAKDALRSICKQGVPLLIDQLRNQVTDQEVDTGDNFTIGTSDEFSDEGKACKLYDENPTDLTVDMMGKDADGQRCEWRAGLSIGNLEPDPIEALFHGTRK